MHVENSLSIANPNPIHTSWQQKMALALASLGVLQWLAAWAKGSVWGDPSVYLAVSFALVTAGVVWFVREEYLSKPAGIKNNYVLFHQLSSREALIGVSLSTAVWVLYFAYFAQSSGFLGFATAIQAGVVAWFGYRIAYDAVGKQFVWRGLVGWMVGVLLTGFYVVLYWWGSELVGLIQLFEPLSQFVRHAPADQWFVYGTLYTFGVIIMGLKFGYKYRHNRYQVIRTLSVMFFQLGFSFLIPSFLKMMNEPEYYFSYFWPLKTDPLKPDGVNWIVQSSSHGLGWYFIGFSALMSFVGVPVLTYFFGKRWYCSWVCGCGALAETVGDPYRQLSDKSLKAWQFERWMIHSVLVAVTLMTILLWVNSAYGGGVLGGFSHAYAKTYGFLIGSMFSGVIGTGFYPILGSRGWCRFGCPQAAILGIFQRKKSRFRITTNGGQCISCGNCSTYCEMGIDVRAYAQRGQDIVRASCVGCGICSAVCPRGVLRLENGSSDIDNRAEAQRAIHISADKLTLID